MAFLLNARRIDIDTGGDSQVVLLRGRDADAFGIAPGDRIQLRSGRKAITVATDITHNSIRHGELGIFADVWRLLKLRDGAPVTIGIMARPLSVEAIKRKLLGQEISAADIRSIIIDITRRQLSTIETTYFVASGYVKPYTNRELIAMVAAMAQTGDVFRWGRRRVVDKHSVGGLAGNRTTMVVIPIIAALGLLIPKTSSRAITSPSGTADTMEVLAPVTFSATQVKTIVNRAGGCLIWGGGLSIAPADDLIIRVSKPLSLEPYDKMLVSILAKKVAMGVRYLVVDLPYGPGTKVPNRTVGRNLERRFQTIGRAFDMRVRVKFDRARQPIGNGIGPALEARDVLRVLQRKPQRPRDLETKAIGLSAELLELSGACRRGGGQRLATEALRSGQAWKKMQDIIRLQGGQPNVDAEDVTSGAVTYDIRATHGGTVDQIDNRAIDDIARTLGAPDHKLGGLYLHQKIGGRAQVGQPLLTLSSHSPDRITLARRSPALKRILHLR
ncbi:MAG: thymidine phosphorylase [Patescibacteria group bacterium]